MTPNGPRINEGPLLRELDSRGRPSAFGRSAMPARERIDSAPRVGVRRSRAVAATVLTLEHEYLRADSIVQQPALVVLRLDIQLSQRLTEDDLLPRADTSASSCRPPCGKPRPFLGDIAPYIKGSRRIARLRHIPRTGAAAPHSKAPRAGAPNTNSTGDP
jgi:hypothetical protein